VHYPLSEHVFRDHPIIPAGLADTADAVEKREKCIITEERGNIQYNFSSFLSIDR